MRICGSIGALNPMKYPDFGFISMAWNFSPSSNRMMSFVFASVELDVKIFATAATRGRAVELESHPSHEYSYLILFTSLLEYTIYIYSLPMYYTEKRQISKQESWLGRKNLGVDYHMEGEA